ncbi:type IV pilin [Halovenus sp. WSH3]|uniref:Type IV pilin n=1 Tax=Halovenus carboxidivorans TaxID=2692199 RepID=A0A6B0T259_9EURY|nr:type IV pilin N-terminal domain-containing protein [Halovenus carboxidivorans]MXR52318.1 type IV pilin [Halovenus carboxidivorans]
MSIRQLLTDDDSAVSPVIGVILMVAITVILAAVIASFVLGLGGNTGEPAPSPTIESSVDNGNLTLEVTGGDDFEASSATVQGTINGNDVKFAMDAANANLGEVTAGDTIRINTTEAFINEQKITSGAGGGSAVANSGGGGSVVPIDSWEIEIIWNPADQDSQVIYSDSS